MRLLYGFSGHIVLRLRVGSMCICIHTRICAFTCVDVCIYIYMNMRMCIYMCRCVDKYIYVYIYI